MSGAEPKFGEKGEKNPPLGHDGDTSDNIDDDRAQAARIGQHLHATEDDILEAKEYAATMSLETVHATMVKAMAIHEHDPNFPFQTLQNIRRFLEPGVMENPEKHETLIEEIKLEAAMITTNSPYAEVRGTVDNHDDPTIPVSTLRAWVIGVFFAIVLSFTNQFFSIRFPAIKITGIIAQLLSFPMGKAWARFMPTWSFRLPFVKDPISVNPGPFNKKEHMLITIVGALSASLPYSNFIFWTQVLPDFFNQQYARSFGYMFVNNMATNFIGYGMAGILRRFLVYPAYCVWPVALVPIALITALHNESNHTVIGPFKSKWKASRFKFFMCALAIMFVYFWFPNFLFSALSYFAWMTWIAPDNRELTILTGMNGGTGLLNPIPTFDWNIFSFMLDPLMVPSFTVFNTTAGMFTTGLMILAFWYSNVWNTGYLPILSNNTHDHFTGLYNVSLVLDDKGMYDQEKYMLYSAPYISASKAVYYGAYFSIYTATITHVALYHRTEIAMGFRSLWRHIFKNRRTVQENKDADLNDFQDVHFRLMQAYPEVSELWYLATLVVAIVLGVIGLAVWPTHTSPAIVLFGVLLCIIFVVPVGIVLAMTGFEVPLVVIAEFIGGMIVEGNALAMNFFKTYGYVTCSHAVLFASDLKMGHYMKIPPRIMFVGQMLSTLISTIVCTAVMQYQINIENVCTAAAPNRFTCPTINSFFTASVLWGTIGPIKMFGYGGQYGWLLMGFPAGMFLVLIVFGLKKIFPNSAALRQIHVVAACAGGVFWSPYSFSYLWPAVPVSWFSWIYIRQRYLAFWMKYNYVLSAALMSGVALSALLMVFSVGWAEVELNWWGNEVPFKGCEGVPCTLKTLDLANYEHFYPWWTGAPAPTGVTQEEYAAMQGSA